MVMKSVFKYIIFLCLYLGIIIEGFSIVIPIALSDRAEQAEQIVLAKLISSHSYWDAAESNIYTSHRLQVTAYLKEGTQQKYITIIVPGGIVGEDAQVVFPNIDMHIGSEYCVFLKRAPIHKIQPQLATSRLANTYFQPYAYMQGVLPLSRGQYVEPITKEVFSEKILVDKIFDKVKVKAFEPNGIVFRSRTHELPRKVATTNTLILKNGLGETTNKFVGGSIESEKELIIQGSNFGTAIGFVQFSNCNTGGISKEIIDYETDIVYWRNDEIRVKVPPFAGTGVVEVKNNSGIIISSANIIIEWTLNPVYSNYRGFDKHTRQMPKLLNVNEKGGYTIHFNTTSSFGVDPLAVAAFERSVNTWRCETKVNWIVDKTGTTKGAVKDDFCVVQYSTDLPAGILGLATTRYKALGSTKCLGMNTLWSVREFDVEFIPNSHLQDGYEWNFGEAKSSTSAFQFDFESIALHELGHALGLGHIIDEEEVMHFSISNGQERRDLNRSAINAGTYKIALSTEDNCITSRPVMMHALNCSDELATSATKPTAYIKVFLEGLFNKQSEEMETIMNSINLLPRIQPFSGSPYHYLGTENFGSGLAGVVDWVLIQLRSVNNTANISHQKAVLLRKDGLIIDTDGSETVDFGLLQNDSFYIAVYHRSHLPIISREPHFFQTAPTTCDFTISEFAAMGDSQQKFLSNKFLLNSGDFDGNGIINNQDFNIWKLNSSAINVYLSADADGNGIINNQDYNLWKANRSKVSVLVK